MRSFLNLFVVSCLFYFAESQLQFKAVTTTNKNGGIEVNFTVETNVTVNYLFTVNCMSDDDDENSDVMKMMQGDGSGMNCTSFSSSDFSLCCDVNCLTNPTFNSGVSIFVNGPVTAGEMYSCDLFGFINDTSVEMFETESFNASSGIPSAPAFEVTVSDRTLIIQAGSEYNGTTSNNVTFDVTLTNVDGEVVHSMTYNVAMFKISGLENGDYSIIVTTINEYGMSLESEAQNATIDVDVTVTNSVTSSVTSSVTTATSSTSPTESQTSNSGANTGAIAGGIAGGVIAILAVVAVVVLITVIILMKKSKGRTVKITPIKKNTKV